MNQLENLLATAWFGNTLQSYGIALIIFLVIWILGSFLVHFIVKLAGRFNKRVSFKFAEFIIDQIKKLPSSFYFVLALFFSTQSLKIPSFLDKVIFFLVTLVLTIAVVRMLIGLFDYLVEEYYFEKQKEKDEFSKATTKNMLSFVKALFWIGALIFFLDNLGINITSLVVGLGIGGIAIALAAQAVLGDLFSSFSIFIDRPFQLGDFVIVDDLMGTVEKIGIKTTRIRSLSGEQLIFSNSDLTSTRIRNYKRMNRRRILFTIGVTYDTPAEKLKKIPEIVKEVIAKIEKATFDRAHFKSFGDFSLNFEIVYYVESGDYLNYMNIQEQINLALKERVEGIGCEFAFPTQTIHIPQTSAGVSPRPT